MSRSLFILKLRHDYSSDPAYAANNQIATGMYNSAKFVVDELTAAGREAKVVIVVDNNAIDREVTDYDPTDVFIEGVWVTPEKLTELKGLWRHRNRKFHVRIHSDIPFLATEGIAMQWIVEYLNRGITIAPNAPRAHEQLTWLAKNMLGDSGADLVKYLPNCYPVDFSEFPVRGPKPPSEFLDVGCFGAFRPMKNHLQQAFTALKYAESKGKQLRFHVNGRMDQAGQQPMKNVTNLLQGAGAELVVHGWEDRETFLTTLTDMDVLMQVSISETFNIVAADATLAGTPILVSSEISWAYPLFADPHSVDDQLRKLDLVMKNPKFFTQNNRTGLSIYANAASRRWTTYLGAE